METAYASTKNTRHSTHVDATLSKNSGREVAMCSEAMSAVVILDMNKMVRDVGGAWNWDKGHDEDTAEVKRETLAKRGINF